MTELGDVTFRPFINSYYAIYVPSSVFTNQNGFGAYVATLGNFGGEPWTGGDTGGVADRPGGLQGLSVYNEFAIFTPVPEPSVPSLVVIGLAFFALARRKRHL